MVQGGNSVVGNAGSDAERPAIQRRPDPDDRDRRRVELRGVWRAGWDRRSDAVHRPARLRTGAGQLEHRRVPVRRHAGGGAHGHADLRANVSPQQYGETAYSFTVEYYAQAGMDESQITGATVTVSPPSGPAITATAGTPTPVGNANPWGEYQEYIVTYTITPPGGSWTSADNGTYTINLGSTIYDTQGNSVGPETLGTFDVETADIGITKFALTRNRSTGMWTGTIKLTNNGTSSFSGPIFVLFDLPGGVTLENASGTYDGEPYLEVTVPGGLLAPRDGERDRDVQQRFESDAVQHDLLHRFARIVSVTMRSAS